MTLLAIDTATEACSVALAGKDGTITERYQIDPRGHSDLVLPMVKELLAEAGLSCQDLDAVSFDSGPGSFTGIRIGLGIAQGLALGLDLPLVGISSLMVLAEGSTAETVLSAIDARMGQVYWARLTRDPGCAEGWVWSHKAEVSDPSVMPALTGNEVGVGSGWRRYRELAESNGSPDDWRPVTFPRAAWVVAIAARILASDARHDRPVPHPIYVRGNVVGAQA